MEKLSAVENFAVTPINTIRIYHADACDTAEKQQKILDLLARNPGIDEIWLSTLAGNESMEHHRQTIAEARPFADALRKMGIIVSMQLSSCVGHFGGDIFENGFQWQTSDLMTDEHGVPAKGVCCLSSPAFREWTGTVMAMYCREYKVTAAYFDDDIRLHTHGPLHDGCFCERCLKEFSDFTGRKWQREELTALLYSKDCQPIRTQWVDFHSKQMSEFLAAVTEIVHRESPDTIIGLQIHHSELFYNCWTYADCYRAMAEASGHPARVRLGGGVWNDFEPLRMLHRSLNIGCDAADAKACGHVDLATLETEEYPCNASSKSLYGMMLESSLGMAFGATSTSFQSGTLWKYAGEQYMEDFFREISRARPYHAVLAGISRSSRLGGLNLALAAGYINEPVYEGTPPGYHWYNLALADTDKLMLTGIPVMMDRNQLAADGIPSVLNAEFARGMDADTFRKCFRNGIIITGNAYLELQKRGIINLEGITAEKLDASRAEILPHPLTGNFAGRKWAWLPWENNAVGFNFAPGCKALPMTRLSTKDNDFAVGAWSLECDEGKMVVLGSPANFDRQYNDAQLEMLRNAADWIGAEPLPARTAGIAPLVTVPAVDHASGKTRAVSILNAGIAPQAAFTVKVRRPLAGRIMWMCLGDQKPVQIGSTMGTESEVTISLPGLSGWNLGTLFVK